MQIQTKRLTLRPIEESDMEAMIGMLTDDIIKQTYMIPDFASREQAEALARRFIALSHDASHVDVGVCKDGELIGFINDVGIEDGEIELGYVIASAHHGQGYMTEALGAMLDKLLGEGFHTVVTGAFSQNAASIRVMEKCGMRRIEKTEQIEYRGKMHDCVYYAIGCGAQSASHVEKARELFLSGCSCSQAVFGAFASECGVDHAMAMKLASSFGGGMGGARELCGAVSGMLMAAGLLFGYSEIGDNEIKTAHYARSRELIEAFKEKHGTMICRELLSDLGKLSENPSERTPEYYKTRPCVRFVETAAALLDAQIGKERK